MSTKLKELITKLVFMLPNPDRVLLMPMQYKMIRIDVFVVSTKDTDLVNFFEQFYYHPITETETSVDMGGCSRLAVRVVPPDEWGNLSLTRQGISITDINKQNIAWNNLL